MGLESNQTRTLFVVLVRWEEAGPVPCADQRTTRAELSPRIHTLSTITWFQDYHNAAQARTIVKGQNRGSDKLPSDKLAVTRVSRSPNPSGAFTRINVCLRPLIQTLWAAARCSRSQLRLAIVQHETIIGGILIRTSPTHAMSPLSGGKPAER